RRIELAYRDRNGSRTSRTIDPLGLVSKSGVWYLVARQGSEYRSFRVDRMLAADITSESFERPSDFDLDAYWSQSSRQYEGMMDRFSVTVSVASESLDTLAAYWKPASVETNGSTCVVTFEFPGREIAVFQLLAWGSKVTVVEPRDLIDEVLTHAQSVLTHYAIG
ncbi:MAG: helix-turn-helix transcriptional regulator, partial [Vulcanimicrobiaceae bacterium]